MSRYIMIALLFALACVWLAAPAVLAGDDAPANGGKHAAKDKPLPVTGPGKFRQGIAATTVLRASDTEHEAASALTIRVSD